MKKNILYVLCLGILFLVGVQPTYGEDLTEGINLRAGKRISDKASLEISSSDSEWDKPREQYNLLFSPKDPTKFPPNLNGIGGDGSQAHAFHTLDEESPWAIIDLKKAYSISQVKIWNRASHLDRMFSPVVFFSNDKKKWTKIAQGNDSFTTWIVNGKKKKARYIKFQCMEGTVLHLYKLHVYGK